MAIMMLKRVIQFKELDDANLQEGELEQLEQEAETLSHSEDIKTALYEADNAPVSYTHLVEMVAVNSLPRVPESRKTVLKAELSIAASATSVTI